MTARHAYSAIGRLLAVLLATLVVGGCGVTAQSEPRTLTSGDLAEAGHGTASPTTPTGSPTNAAGGEVDVYFVRAQRLVAVPRTVDLTDVPGPALAQLLAGPTAEEASRSVTTAIPPGTTALDVTVVDGIAVVAVPRQFDALTAPEQIIAVAQLLYTLTGIRGIVGLQLTDGSDIVDVPNGAGELSEGPVYRADFGSLAPTAPTSTATPTPTG